MNIYGTLGPSCQTGETLTDMFCQGMTGIRLNLSHTTLANAADQIRTYHAAAARCGVQGQLLIDMQGPELRVGRLDRPLPLPEGTICREIPLPAAVREQLQPGQILLLDDGKIRAQVTRDGGLQILNGGILQSGKSVAIEGYTVQGPAVTEQDFENLRHAKEFGVTGVMQPFVRSAADLRDVKQAMKEAGCADISLFAKIENLVGVEHLESFFPYADEIVIARGDLGNAVPLWELPALQKKIAACCKKHNMPFMVVTQMLASMEQSAVPTRAEVCDIFNAVLDGASSVMVTGETAVGRYPVGVIRYLAKTAQEAQSFLA